MIFFVSDHTLSETVIIFSTTFHSKKLKIVQEILHYMYFCGSMPKTNLLNFFENKPTLSKDDI